MPAEYSFDTEHKLLRFELSGQLSIQEMFDIITAALEHPSFVQGYDILTDHTQLTRFITPDEATRMSHHLGKFSTQLSDAKWAIVTINPASYGMMRMLSVYLENIPIHVEIFDSTAGAMQWLRPK